VGKGFYSGVLSKDFTTTAGEYTVTVKGSGVAYQRVFSRQVQLNPGPIDYEKSFGEIAMLKSAVKKSIYLLRVYAADRFGNAITRPSLADRIKADVKDAQLFREPSISFGAMQRELTVSPGKRPVLDRVRIDNQKVKVIDNKGTQRGSGLH
jgi:hypothetical protein